MITDKHVFFNKDAYNDMLTEIEILVADGWVKCPPWLPAGIKGYWWRFPGQIHAYMKPAAKLRHILRYKFIPGWWRKYKAGKWLQDLKSDLKPK
jgi:hypothetical protein